MRHLATIRKIKEIRPIPNADRIEVAVIDGWEVVVNKSDGFIAGDLVIYIEIDSVLPDRPEFEFMRKYKFRVKTIKLRGQVSQGLVLPMTIQGLPKGEYKLGQDITDLLGIKKYDPEAAKIFCRDTGVDALAVAIGNAHGNYPVLPSLRFDILEQIDRITDTPLVLHGGTGISDEQFRKAISLGIRKINIATASFDALANASKAYTDGVEKPDYFRLSALNAEAVKKNVLRHIAVFSRPL